MSWQICNIFSVSISAGKSLWNSSDHHGTINLQWKSEQPEVGWQPLKAWGRFTAGVTHCTVKSSYTTMELFLSSHTVKNKYTCCGLEVNQQIIHTVQIESNHYNLDDKKRTGMNQFNNMKSYIWWHLKCALFVMNLKWFTMTVWKQHVSYMLMLCSKSVWAVLIA